MDSNTSSAASKAGLLALLIAAPLLAQEGAPIPTVKAIAEVESKVAGRRHEGTALVPATRLVPGDRLIYTLEVRNAGSVPLPSPLVIQPVPAHVVYVADSAVGPGADVSYSVDGGHRFDAAANLQVPGPDGQSRAAVAADYTHIRWQLKHPLNVNSVAFVRFRAVVK